MCRILIVDDESTTLVNTKKYLEKLFIDHEIITTKVTYEALQKIKNLKDIDIILFNSLDNEEPNGVTFAKICRDHNPYVLLFYMFWNLIDPKRLINLSKIGIDGFFQKPVSLEMLETQIANALVRHECLINGKTPKHLSLEKAVDTLIDRLEHTLARNNRGIRF